MRRLGAVGLGLAVVLAAPGCQRDAQESSRYGRAEMGSTAATGERSADETRRRPAHEGRDLPELAWGEWAQYRGYLKARRQLEEPLALIGGPITVKVKQQDGGAHLALPDYRRLDPTVFGTPSMPRSWGGTPLESGVPPDLRQQSGGVYTQTSELGPFGNKTTVLSKAQLTLEAVDATATDGAQSRDTIRLEASWTGEDGATYAVKCSKVAPHGVDYPSFGGVLTNHIIHGASGIGSPLLPTTFAYLAVFGTGEVYRNGERLEEDRLVHAMLTEQVRGDAFRLVFDEQVDPNQVQMHLLVPPVKLQDGRLVSAPVRTGYSTPEGEELPFWHVTFSNIRIESTRSPMPAGARGPAQAAMGPSKRVPSGSAAPSGSTERATSGSTERATSGSTERDTSGSAERDTSEPAERESPAPRRRPRRE